MNKKCFFRIATFFIALILFSIIEKSPVLLEAKKGASFTMKVSINFGQTVKYGRSANVNAYVQAKVNDFYGYIQAVPENDSEQIHAVYETEIALKKGIKKKINFSIPIENDTTSVTFKMVGPDGRERLIETQKLRIEPDPSVFYLGVIGQDETKFEKDEGKAFRAIPIAYDEMPESVEGFDCFEGIYIGSRAMYEEPLTIFKKIREWNWDGGTVLLESQSKVLRNYLGGEEKEKRVIRDEKDNVLYYVYPNKKGVIIEWCYQDNMAAAVGGTGERTFDIWHDLKAHHSDYKEERRIREANGRDTGEQELIRSLKTVDTKYLPKPMLYMGISLVYIVVAGPVLFWFVRKSKKNICYYSGILITSFVFILVFIAAGQNTVLNKLIVQSVSIYNYDDASDRVKTETFFSIVAPNRSSEKFTIKKQNNVILKDSNPALSMSKARKRDKKEYEVKIANREKNATVKIQNPLYMKPYVFKSESSHESKGSISSSLGYDGRTIYGYMENHLGFDIEQAVLLSNNQVVPIGSFDNETKFIIGGKQHMVNHLKIYTDPNQVYKTKRNLNGLQAQDNMEEYLKNAVMQYCLKDKCFTYNNDTFLIGFLRTSNKSDTLKNSNSKKNINVMVYHIGQVKTNYCNKRMLTDIEKWEEIHIGRIDPLERRIEGDYVIMDYYVPSEYRVLGLWLNKNLNDKKKFNGMISIWNVKTKKYETVYPDSESEVLTRLKERNYLTSFNKFTLKYSLTEDAAQLEQDILPVISVFGEVK
ncbi:hypothetical protein [[Clostridium] polysaccharolyticum]|uniref:Uncharacterized protein n=1 Tax=[Clostridium] polysaccharolyticum TaxID=29364 RepID=A0A1H9ZG05_9FIRM|nr:hypothetical protein [[Clostridium] polysaccharolyticum]SES80000.1 hypothetical protein SAMN04487772_103165 [[Clostridium] polysaccharolyticum]